MSWVGRAAIIGAALFLLTAAVAEFVEIPGFSYSLMLGAWGIDVLAACLVLTMGALVIWRRRRTLMTAAVALILVDSTVLVATSGAIQLRAVYSSGASVDWLALTGVKQGGSLPDQEPVILEDVASGQELRAGIWYPRDAAGRVISKASVRGGVGVVVLVHGGGWSNGNRRNPMTRGQAAWFASQGYLAIALDYPLSTPQLATWRLAESRVACGLAWVATHADRLGGNGARIALVGDSAGGNLALELAYEQVLGTLPEFPTSCGSAVPEIAAVSVTYPIVDPVGFYRNPDLVMGPFVRERAGNYLGGTPGQVNARYLAVHPGLKLKAIEAAGLSAKVPPTVLVAGERDHVVPVEGLRGLDNELSRLGVAHRTLILPMTDHVFDLNPGSAASQAWRAATLKLWRQAGIGEGSEAGMFYPRRISSR